MSRITWFAFVWSAGLVGALANASCSSPAPVEQCFLPGDEDANGLADCDDSACWRANGDCKQKCDSETADQDADGLAGCDDPDCWVMGGECAELCTGAKDEDGDAKVDCSDSDCWVKDGGCTEVCKGGGDEDADGTIDCADDDCWVPESGCAEVCSGGHDEDGDTKVDCYDESCFKTPECTEKCTGGIDEDVDGKFDCEDSDCKGDMACVPTYDADVKPIFAQHCGGGACHIEGIGAGGWVLTKYDTLLKDALYCPGQSKGWCSLFRIKEGTMPKDKPAAVTPVQLDIVQRWVDGGQLP